MSDISDLRARLAQEEARNRELRGYLMELESGVSAARRELTNFTSNVQQKLDNSEQRISTSHENIIRAHEVQAEIDKMYVRFKHMELANKKIRECNNKKYYEFSNYATVRKIVQGMLDNLNVNMISDAVIYKSIEKEHLKTPDYWLTSVLLSIMAWKNDDKFLADRAMEISLELDKKNSAIFYMLFNLRMGRDEAALKWFELYQECELKGSDQKTFLMLFSLISQTMQDTFGDKMKYEISDFINKVIAMNLQAEDFNAQDIVDAIEGQLNKMKQGDNLKLNMMKRCLTDYADMADIIMSAENNQNILQFIMDTANVNETERNTYIEQFINDEIAKPNEVEASVYDEIEYNELIISCNGDVEAANNIYQQQKEKQAKNLKLISEMIGWIYNNNNKEDVSGPVRKNMFHLTLDMQKQAVLQYFDHYRARIKDIHTAVLGDYTTDIDFNNRGNEAGKISSYYEGLREQQLSQITYILAIIGAVVGVAGIGGAVYLMNPVVLIFTLVGAVLAAYNVISNNLQKKHILETCDLNIRNKNELMDQLFSEYGTYKKILAENEEYCENIIWLFDNF